MVYLAPSPLMLKEFHVFVGCVYIEALKCRLFTYIKVLKNEQRFFPGRTLFKVNYSAFVREGYFSGW